jgi:hypothetical protein
MLAGEAIKDLAVELGIARVTLQVAPAGADRRRPAAGLEKL